MLTRWAGSHETDHSATKQPGSRLLCSLGEEATFPISSSFTRVITNRLQKIMNNKLVKNKCGYVINFFSPRPLCQTIYIYGDGVGRYGKLSNNKNKTTEKYIYRTQGSVVNSSEG